MKMPKPEYKDLPSLIKDAEGVIQFLGEDSVGYMYLSMLDFLKALDTKYTITMVQKEKP